MKVVIVKIALKDMHDNTWERKAVESSLLEGSLKKKNRKSMKTAELYLIVTRKNVMIWMWKSRSYKIDQLGEIYRWSDKNGVRHVTG